MEINTFLYSAKFSLKTGIIIGFSILGNLATKAIISGILIIVGAPLAPYVTIILGLLGGIVFGKIFGSFANKIGDEVFGKDEFVLSSSNLYYRYIPDRYRIRGNNPHLKWNKTYLCATVKSYIIECIINDVETAMRVINIPNTVYELYECLGYEINENYQTDDYISEDSTDSTDDDEEGKKFICKTIRQGNLYAGDLIIPYKGINENAHKIDFIIYGINKERINNKEWSESRDKEVKKQLIEIGFVLPVY